ncbi:MAG TPA: glycosyl transferase [Bdellovibrionales bacterium]|nr:glycosyl transferase [Bdellovibrionales bacterium]
MMNTTDLNIAVLIPCYNEDPTIEGVITDFRKHLPNALIYVFDNNSKDKTAEVAQRAGANVIQSKQQGKGHVVRHMFDLVEADYYVMADGDSTYPADAAPGLIKLAVDSGADMIVGQRLEQHTLASFRRFHKFGNHLISKIIRLLFQVSVTDVLSGYRVLSRRFVKSVPLISKGFEVETELTLQAAIKRFLILETPVRYKDRPAGSVSKLNTFSDGILIFRTIFFIFRYYRPFIFFGFCSALLALISVVLGTPAILDYINKQYVYHLPSAVLAAAFGILSVLMFCVGMVLETVHRYHQETFLLWKRLLNLK